jgi:hypothetical protein
MVLGLFERFFLFSKSFHWAASTKLVYCPLLELTSGNNIDYYDNQPCCK